MAKGLPHNPNAKSVVKRRRRQMDNLSLLTKQANIQTEIARIVSEHVVNNQKMLIALSEIEKKRNDYIEQLEKASKLLADHSKQLSKMRKYYIHLP
jgi:tRNA uridine 5-carbamoylmethylation protein Kti12